MYTICSLPAALSSLHLACPYLFARATCARKRSYQSRCASVVAISLPIHALSDHTPVRVRATRSERSIARDRAAPW